MVNGKKRRKTTWKVATLQLALGKNGYTMSMPSHMTAPRGRLLFLKFRMPGEAEQRLDPVKIKQTRV